MYCDKRQLTGYVNAVTMRVHSKTRFAKHIWGASARDVSDVLFKIVILFQILILAPVKLG